LSPYEIKTHDRGTARTSLMNKQKNDMTMFILSIHTVYTTKHRLYNKRVPSF